DGALRIRCTGPDPYLHGPALDPAAARAGPAVLRFRARAAGAGGGQVFWITREAPGWDEPKSVRFDLAHDGVWHDYALRLPVEGTLARLRLDPGDAPGTVDLDDLAVEGTELHPLEIARVEQSAFAVDFVVRNHGASERVCEIAGQRVTVAARGAAPVSLRTPRGRPFTAFPLLLSSPDLPPLVRPLFLHQPDAPGDWIVRASAGLTLRLARDGSGARLELDGAPVAVLAPLVHVDGAVPALTAQEEGEAVLLAGDGVRAELRLRAGELDVRIESDRPCEGPVVRALGPLEQGLFAGLEYLGKGERSSSTLDLETPDHIRYAPDPLLVTMPLMACVTGRGAVALTWTDMTLAPTFAAPDFVDGAADEHRMALCGRRIEATIAVRRAPLTEMILWAVRRRGLPPLPVAPRTPEAQRALCRAALDGPLKGGAGWGHCAEPGWGRAPYADHASTLWRLTGEAPRLPTLAEGGSHLPNDAVWFALGRAQEWLDLRSDQARGLLAEQQADGSFRYSGKYRKGHFEDTASGFCASKALPLLEHARRTGDAAARAGGLKALAYMTRFRTPRGAQTWELSLHTPDVLAAALLAWCYVDGFEETGDPAWRERARAWALSGLPFVYQWSRLPVMAYATVPVYGATNWVAPNWIGTPVQWCGTFYAYALLRLARHDSTLDWRRLAEGITLAAEQMQYPSGPLIGCLPDVFTLPGQQRAGPSINPCALVSLRLALAGEADALAVASDGTHRVVAPFPVELRGGQAAVKARAGVAYQVLIDGRRIVDVMSQGEDLIPLE
ncbi:MAG: hypothetical protein HZA54_19610, partial [Planctomycetes bacterium]|nr:hypothetical protein [Planctomycetota bacterium]